LFYQFPRTNANLDRAFEVLYALRTAIDSRAKTTHFLQLQQRTWLIHWGLFLFFNPSQAPQSMYKHIIGFLLHENSNNKMLNTIQTNCCHILRYLTVAVICSEANSETKYLPELVQILVAETFRDPITSFVVSLFHDFDMDAAHRHLRDCQAIFEADFFLAPDSKAGQEHLKLFLEASRPLIFEKYLETHERVDISLIASRLHISEEEVFVCYHKTFDLRLAHVL
jgi:translation initiation factor 3 subunit E